MGAIPDYTNLRIWSRCQKQFLSALSGFRFPPSQLYRCILNKLFFSKSVFLIFLAPSVIFLRLKVVVPALSKQFCLEKACLFIFADVLFLEHWNGETFLLNMQVCVEFLRVGFLTFASPESLAFFILWMGVYPEISKPRQWFSQFCGFVLEKMSSHGIGIWLWEFQIGSGGFLLGVYVLGKAALFGERWSY